MKVGAMVSPATGWMKAHDFLPYSIDNGKYADTMAERDWDVTGFLKLLDKASEGGIDPEFIVVPDEMFNRDETLRLFDKWAPKLEGYGFRLAMACQDGMTPADVPAGVVAFIGGSDSFKRQAYSFTEACDHVHIGRVSGYKRLIASDAIGATSVDGSGWFRCGGIENHSGKQRIDPLLRYLRETVEGSPQQLLF